MRHSLTIACIIVGLLCAARAARGAPVQVPSFGDNPGNLDMFAHVPENRPSGKAPLLVVLHGCTQNALGMSAAGFDQLADELGFYVVYPQQKSANNPVSCFNWAGEYGDQANLERGKGENQSIVSMVEKMATDYDIDRSRVYVVGFSAGGGMAAVLLATWPDVFSAGAIAAGVPYRCASDQLGAFDCMNLSLHPDRKKSPEEWGRLVRAAAPGYSGDMPRVLILRGERDSTLHPDASLELIEQWLDVHGVTGDPDSTEAVGAHQVTRYQSGGAVVVEGWLLSAVGHAFPVDPDEGCGQVGAYIEDHDLCGARRALAFFGIDDSGGGGGSGGGGDTGGGSGGDEGPEGGKAGDNELDSGGCASASPARGATGAWLVVLLALWGLRRRSARTARTTRSA